ncbi:hypothetical protein V2J09_013439 [Rumex salicifolius]
MGLNNRHVRHESAPIRTNFSLHRSSSSAPIDQDLSWPFGRIEGIDRDDVRETAYEIFFASCRSSPGFGGRHALAFYSSQDKDNSDGPGSGPGPPRGSLMVPNSRIKKALGLRQQMKRTPWRRASSSSLGSPKGGSPRQGITLTLPAKAVPRRPMTSAEIMRQQMRVTEQSDVRLRKTLMRTAVGQQTGRKAETIILPLELLRHLKPSEFNDNNEYHVWQRRQLRILEVGLILHPFAPLDRSLSPHAATLRALARSSDLRPLDTTSRNSDSLPALASSVLALAWHGSQQDHNRNQNNEAVGPVCHWADGYPFNIHIYVVLLQSVFDLKDETVVLDEVDELAELLKKTWSTLAITKPVHNVCFAWVFFTQFVATGRVEPDLLVAAYTLVGEITAEAGCTRRTSSVYEKLLASVLSCFVVWTEKQLVDYHVGCGSDVSKGTHGVVLENLVALVLLTRQILDEDVSTAGDDDGEADSPSPNTRWSLFEENRVDFYIRSSLKNAFDKMVEEVGASDISLQLEENATQILSDLAQGTEELAIKEKETYSSVLKRWHPVAAGVASVTLHNCYGSILGQYLTGAALLCSETIDILQMAGKLEKFMVQMVVEDTVDCEDGGKSLVRQMVPYEVDSILLRLLRKWIDEKLQETREWIQRAKDSETWNPKSKSEPFAQSAGDLMKLLREIIDEFFLLPVGISDDLLHDLANGLDRVAREYITFVASCGTKQSYMPSLPPLTRCNRDSRFSKLWKKASCSVGIEDTHQTLLKDGNEPHPSTSRGTQRLYIRLNTLHHLLSHLNSLDKALSLSLNRHKAHQTVANPKLYFELSRAKVQSAISHVTEVAAYRLLFLDSHSLFYESLYIFDVTNSRIKPSLRILKQNITLLNSIVIEKAQPMAVKEVRRASFEAFLMVLLAGGGTRVFNRADHEMIEFDFVSLKRMYYGVGVKEEVDNEAENGEGVVALMGETTEQIIEEFSVAACERSGIGVAGLGAGQKLPMPPTTGRWNRSDPNTILRVLCHRNDPVANSFLKKTFQLPKRR